jgi:2,4-dienoyl-CoA reductase (NADPH2)
MLRNRMITTSMAPGQGYAGPDGEPTEMFLNYLEERAAGGYALILQSIAFFRKSPDEPEGIMPAAYKKEHIAGLKQAAAIVHKHGAYIAGQAISLHAWRLRDDAPLEQWGPSDVRLMKNSPPVREMAKADIAVFREQIVQSAKILQAGGWDAIEILAGVGSTLCRFMSPATNKRTDEYGGSLENRCRFTVECIQAVKEACGKDFPVLVRWTPIDFISGGNEIEDALKIVPILEQAGAAYHNLQVGWHESSIPLTTKQVPDGHWSYIAAEIKKVAKIPVVTAYRQSDPYIMEQEIAEGRADLIGGVRYSIADPAFPRKVMADRLSEINMCICCCRCLDDVVSRGLGLRYCSVNPKLGPELETPFVKADEVKKVLVIGSGPAGLSAAKTAYERGHEVILYERGPRIGGCLSMSAIFSPMYERLTSYYMAYLKAHPNLKVKLNTTVTRDLIQAEHPDAVIVAIGGEPMSLNVPGNDAANVVRSHDFLALLNGDATKKPGLLNKLLWPSGAIVLKYIYSPRFVKRLLKAKWPFAQRVGIIGGGLPGCELGAELLHNGRNLVIIDENKKIGHDVGPSDRFHVTSEFKNSESVKIVTEAKVKAISSQGIEAVVNGASQFYPVDTVAVTLGFEPNPGFAQRVKGLAPFVAAIGDCENPARMADATKAGYLVALEL